LGGTIRKRLSSEIACAIPVTRRRTGSQLGFRILRISPEKSINSVLFQAVPPTVRPQSMKANNQYITPQKIEGE
jgi:hypothetical protein